MLVLDIYKCLKLAFSDFDQHSFVHAVCAIAALDCALHALGEYYTKRINKSPILEAWPWCTTVADYHLQYFDRMLPSKLIFSANATRNNDHFTVVVKFTQSYSVAAHKACQAAPMLLASKNVC
jgi:hypothetical protein